jgi:hypothetical protein
MPKSRGDITGQRFLESEQASALPLVLALLLFLLGTNRYEIRVWYVLLRERRKTSA